MSEGVSEGGKEMGSARCRGKECRKSWWHSTDSWVIFDISCYMYIQGIVRAI